MYFVEDSIKQIEQHLKQGEDLDCLYENSTSYSLLESVRYACREHHDPVVVIYNPKHYVRVF